ncbi:cupin domain-containing protein [Burkholderia sp. Ac-20353]|uniref:cupin domain-containing protein n=1 Tax=Burkholderia sp. Ac-20353 TaxID=2703894 RepID=UPI00197B1061|nr:cupin domain-containing protein [Burkholderia sp. Ac-20353]MBN3787624.1 cupin domain-containing protein [Burkholderia sp. Ac-20353]
MEPERSVHSLNADAVRLKKPLGDLTGLTQLGVVQVTLMPGHGTAEYHMHHYEEECVYVLSGYGTATIGERDHAVGPGDFLGFRRGGDAHTLVNTGDVPLVLFVAGQRLEHDVCDYPRIGKRLFVAGKREALIDLPDGEDA